MEEEEHIFYVYVLENHEGRFYVGHTNNIERRISEHNDPEERSKYTAKNGPWRLVWSRPFPSRSSAMAYERYIKKMKSSKWIYDLISEESADNQK